jgi:hypothetical protein
VRIAIVACALAAARAAHADPPPSPWADAPAHSFVSGEVEGGGLVKAEVAAGFGRPHTSWLGAEVMALSTTEFAAAYGGLRAHLPFVDVTVGGRGTASYARPRLAVMDAYRSTDGPGGGARYATIDAAVVGFAPVPRGYAMLWIDLVHPLGVGADERIYEEYERAVVGRGTTVAVRLGYLASFADDRVQAGPVGERLWMGGRDAAEWRVGGAVFWQIGARWDLEAALTAPVSGPDALGAWDGLWGTGVVRYVWASG